jgi:hypothetical protein
MVSANSGSLPCLENGRHGEVEDRENTAGRRIMPGRCLNSLVSPSAHFQARRHFQISINRNDGNQSSVLGQLYHFLDNLIIFWTTYGTPSIL